MYIVARKKVLASDIQSFEWNYQKSLFFLLYELVSLVVYVL